MGPCGRVRYNSGITTSLTEVYRGGSLSLRKQIGLDRDTLTER